MFKFVLLLCSLDHRVLGAAMMQMVCGMHVVLCVMCTHVYVIRDTYTPQAAHVGCVGCGVRVQVRGCAHTCGVSGVCAHMHAMVCAHVWCVRCVCG